jgi:hypothetical protein
MSFVHQFVPSFHLQSISNETLLRDAAQSKQLWAYFVYEPSV